MDGMVMTEPINYRKEIYYSELGEIIENLVQAAKFHEEGTTYAVTIRRKRRSNDQNDYFHKMVGDIAIATGHTPEEVKYHVVAEVFGLEEFVVKGKKYHRRVSTSSLPIDQMVLLNSHVEVMHAEYI
jgi:hypothetical protein